MTKNYEDPIFVSVHFNSAGWRPAAEGLEIFVLPPLGSPSIGADPNSRADNETRPGDPYEPESFVLANTIHQTLLGKLDSFDRGVKRARYAVLRNAKVPSVLIEGGFLTNPEEAKKIHSETWRQKYAVALADGLMAYMALANEGTPAPRAIDLDREPTDEFVVEE
jgi:N-acetylmuramoyl-L-alanine amidase